MAVTVKTTELPPRGTEKHQPITPTVRFGRPVILEVLPAQGQFIADSVRYPAFIAGRGSGKTVAGAVKSLSRLGVYSSVGIVAAPTYPMLEQAAKPALFEVLDKAGKIDHRFKYIEKKALNEVWFPLLQAKILFCSLDSWDRVRGINASWGWIDEAPYITYDAWRTIQASVRIVLGGLQPQLFTTGTPKGRNWFYQEFVVKTNADLTGKRRSRYNVTRATSYSNPFLYEDFIEDLAYEGRYAQQEIDGEFVAYEGQVYPAFSRERHIMRSKEKALADDIIPSIDTTGWYSIIVGDIGTRNPTAILTLRVSPNKEWVHIHREFYQRGLSSRGIIDAFSEAYNLEKDEKPGVAKGTGRVELALLDPSAAGYIMDLQEAGIDVQGANNKLTEGIGKVTTYIERGFSIDPSCVNTMAEFDAYAYQTRSTAEANDKPAKQADHAMDALRYGVMGIDDIITGSWILN